MMIGMPVALRRFSLLARREFWSFKVFHAVLGGMLSIAGAAGGLFVSGGLGERIQGTDNQIAAIQARLEAIQTTLAQFRIVQSNGVILGAISTSNGISPEYRDSFINLMFVLRRTPALSLVGEIHAENPDAFRSERDELDHLIARAVAPERTRQSWEDVLNFEMSREKQLLDLQNQLQLQRAALAGRRRELESTRSLATVIGFAVQQLGFLVVLLAGLVHEHASRIPVRS